MTTTHNITWTAAKGQEIRFSVTADYGLTDSGRRRTGGRKEVFITGYIDGEDEDDYHITPVKGHATIVARFGSIGLVQARLDQLNAAIAAVEAEIAAHNAECDACAARGIAIKQSSIDIANAMRCGE